VICAGEINICMFIHLGAVKNFGYWFLYISVCTQNNRMISIYYCKSWSIFPNLFSLYIIIHDSVYQPPDAVHCPECNVCVEGYDHHCPWMGTCIGKKNFTSFMVFNLTWLFYLLYAIIWVTLFGNSFYGTGAMIEDSGSSGDE